MYSEWFSFVMRASLLLLISGSCVALLSRIYPLTSPRWHRIAWGIVLLQGLVLFPISLTMEPPDWFVNHRLVAASSMGAESSPEPVTTSIVAANRAASVPAAAAESFDIVQAMSEGQNPGEVFETQRPDGHRTKTNFPEVAAVKRQAWPHSDVSHQERNAGLLSTDARSSSTGTHRMPSAVGSVVRWTEWLVIVWSCGVVGFVGFGLVNYIILNVALMKARPARRSWAKELQELCLELNLDHSIAMDVHPVLGPLICWTPAGHRIVVPMGLWSELTPDERAAVLHHELSHLRRGDLWKSMLARFILALHWFNPLAWISARRFDESAEWACDALMASERPARVTHLANALLAATTARDGSPILAMSATGGPLFQRIRRLVSWDHRGDSVMQRLVWCGLLCPLVCLGLVQLRFIAPLAAQTTNSSAGSVAALTPTDEGAGGTSTVNPSAEANRETAQESAKLKEITERIVVGEQENLKRFIELIKTPAGQIVMADRAAMQAQNATSDQDAVSEWQQFVTDHFYNTGTAMTVKADFQSECDAFVKVVNVMEAELTLIAPVLKEVADALDTSTEPAQILQRFLKHEGAPAFVYMQEFRSRLHPRIEDLSEVFSDLLVRNKDGRFVIRPARRGTVEDRLKNIDRLQPMLKRFEEELAAWSNDLANPDKQHGDLKAMLADPNFAVFLASRNLTENDEPNDEHFDDNFYWLEEATNDAPAGLILNVESEELKEIEAEMARFTAIQQERSVLEQPLGELVDRLDVSDDLHVRFKEYLSTDLALMIVVREMNYSPITADEAAREWLAYLVTRGDNGKYTITSESPDELVSNSEDFFREFREVRRRGRMIDEFASKLGDEPLKSAIQTLSGKLMLDELVERSAIRPDVDGLQLWFDAHFEETAEGLKLFDGAGEEVDAVINEAAELEAQLSKSDF